MLCYAMSNIMQCHYPYLYLYQDLSQTCALPKLRRLWSFFFLYHYAPGNWKILFHNTTN